jgi:tyrosyl-tRNA synthetase
MPSHVVSSPTSIVRLLVETSLAKSNNDARRLIQGGGVRLNTEKVSDENLQVPAPSQEGTVLQVGRKKFVRLVNLK